MCVVLLTLQGTRTPKYARGFTLFVAAAVLRLGAAGVASSMDSVQPNVFSMVMDQVRHEAGREDAPPWLQTAGTRKAACGGLGMCLCMCRCT